MSLDSKNKVVLVTGGSGYLGGWAVVALLLEGYRVRTTIRSLSREAEIRAQVSSQVDPEDRLSVVAADLMKDDGWNRAVDGADAVLHVASPMGNGTSRGQDLIEPAREGTLRVLKAAAKAGVDRVVLTSSVAASSPRNEPKQAPKRTDETVWTDLTVRGVDLYSRSKTLAERSAWEFIQQAGGRTTLTTILPGCVLGPVMPKPIAGSVEMVSRMLTGQIPALPRIGFSIIDTRDLIGLHLKAMTAPEAAGQRLIASADFLWMTEIAQILRDNLGPRAAKVPTRIMPDFLLRLAAPFHSEARFFADRLGLRSEFDASKAESLLNWHPRPARQAVLDCASSVIENGLA